MEKEEVEKEGKDENTMKTIKENEKGEEEEELIAGSNRRSYKEQEVAESHDRPRSKRMWHTEKEEEEESTQKEKTSE